MQTKLRLEIPQVIVAEGYLGGQQWLTACDGFACLLQPVSFDVGRNRWSGESFKHPSECPVIDPGCAGQGGMREPVAGITVDCLQCLEGCFHLVRQDKDLGSAINIRKLLELFGQWICMHTFFFSWMTEDRLPFIRIGLLLVCWKFLVLPHNWPGYNNIQHIPMRKYSPIWWVMTLPHSKNCMAGTAMRCMPTLWYS